MAILKIRTAKTASASSRDYPISMESTVVLTREPAELNLDNNTASVVQELSAPVHRWDHSRWHGGRENPATRTCSGSLTGSVDGVVGFGEPRVGSASFEFDGVQGAIRVPEFAGAQFRNERELFLEFWMSIPPDAGIPSRCWARKR